MIYYCFDPITRKYLYSEDTDNQPAYSTTSPPSNINDIFDVINGVWTPAPPPTPAEINAPIYAQLAKLDEKLIRPLAEGETDRVAEIVAQKQALRAQLV